MDTEKKRRKEKIMMNIDTHEKYIGGEPNAYYEGFVEDSGFYRGYRFAVDNLADVLDAMPVDLFENIEIPMVKTILNQTARACSDYISDTMKYNKDEMVIWLIDKMTASEYAKKRKQLFDVEDGMNAENVAAHLNDLCIQSGFSTCSLDDCEEHNVCSEGTEISE